MLSTNVKKIEQQSLKIGIFINLLMSVTGLIVFSFTHLQALFLDASFVLVEVISGIIAANVSQVSQKRTKSFPKGLFILEPLYIFFKSILVISLMTVTAWNVSCKAYEYFFNGIGTQIKTIPVLIYSIVMVILGFCLLEVYRHGNAKVNDTSELLFVESKNSLIDVMLSAGIGVVAIFLMFIPEGSPLSFLLYTGDFFITVTLVITFVNQPIGYMKQAVREILGGTITVDAVKQKVYSTVKKNTPSKWKFEKVLVFKAGMHLQVEVHCVPQEAFSISDLNEAAQVIKEGLVSAFKLVDISFVIEFPDYTCYDGKHNI
ncbi:cation transporter [Liquorilactobacillus oeni]|uniref:cation transporter n=1 Tax=Liquorilactobacillus oeni TaxID=303241 RepID=UPI000ACC2914|nr:cation transporter [Liquorilactobacillus oeni]